MEKDETRSINATETLELKPSREPGSRRRSSRPKVRTVVYRKDGDLGETFVLRYDAREGIEGLHRACMDALYSESGELYRSGCTLSAPLMEEVDGVWRYSDPSREVETFTSREGPGIFDQRDAWIVEVEAAAEKKLAKLQRRSAEKCLYIFEKEHLRRNEKVARLQEQKRNVAKLLNAEQNKRLVEEGL